MVTTSAGILLYRLGGAGAGAVASGAGAAGEVEESLEVLIAHMGGPFWASKESAAWSIPKGEYDEDAEEPLAAAHREFAEELGIPAPEADYAELGTFAYSSGKRIVVYVADGAGFAASGFTFGEFEMEWPPRSGKVASFPEVDRAEWVGVGEARERLVKGQRPALDALVRQLTEVAED